MKEELQGKLVEILTSIQSAAGRASDFAMDQLPEIAQSYVAYGRVYSAAVVATLLIVTCVSLFVAFKFGYLNHNAVETSQYNAGDWQGHRVFAAVIGTGASAIFAGALLANLNGALLVWLAPKVWLLQQLAALVK